MGLNLGVRIKQQSEGPYQYGSNPQGTPEEIAGNLYDHLERVFGGGEYSITVELRDGWWDFDCRVFGYGRGLAEGVSTTDLHREIIAWAWQWFDDQDGVEMKTYWVG